MNLENIAVLAISKEVVQGIGHGSPQVIIRLVFAQIISKITGSEVTPFAVITDESTGLKYPLADYELLIRQVLRFNAAKVSVKMGTFSQYDHPHTLSRYAEVADCLKPDGNTDEEMFYTLTFVPRSQGVPLTSESVRTDPLLDTLTKKRLT